MKINGELILREIAGESILIPVGETALRLSGMITLTESGALLWKRLQTECSEEELVDAVLEAYDTDRAAAQADVQAFLGQLRQLELL